MFFKIWFIVLVLLSVGVVLVGCFEEADNPLQEEVEGPGVVEVPGEVPENEEPPPQDVVPRGPVVRLVSEGLEWRERRVFLQAYAEIDAPLDHHLFVCIVRERWNPDDDFFGIPGDVERGGSSLYVIKKGNVRSGSFVTSTDLAKARMHKKLVIRLLPGDDRLDIELPKKFFFGVFNGVPHRPGSGEVPEGYAFNPYQVGEPSEVSHEFD